MIDYNAPVYDAQPGQDAALRKYVARVSSATSPWLDVSIITPYYNTEAFFSETFHSIQAQSLQNWQWIIVDDGSTDAESVERLAKFSAQDQRIQVLRQDNAGPAAARNTAFDQCKGRYVCLLDSDDLIEPTYLEKCVWFLDSNPEFAFCNSYSVVFGDQQYLWTTGFERGAAHVQANSGPPISVIRRQAYADAGGFDASIRFGHEDWDFWLAMAKAGHWGYTLPEFQQWYRKRGHGRFEQIMRSGDINSQFEAHIREKYQGLAAHFPTPSRAHPQPYETPTTQIALHNPLQAQCTGRKVMVLLPWMVAGGADRVNLDLIEGILAKDCEVTVCATLMANHQWEHQFSRLTPDIFVLPNFLRPSDYPRFLAYLISSRQIDTVLITGSTLGYQLLPYLRSVSPGVAFLDMCHVEEPHWNNGGHPRCGVGYQDALDANITTTAHLAAWMQAHGAQAHRIKTLYTGIRTARNVVANQPDSPLSPVQQIRLERGLADDLPIIVFAGRLCEQKRPLLLADILRNVRDAGTPFHAIIMGEGELKAPLQSQLKKYHLMDCVSLLDNKPHDYWLRLLSQSHILLMPSQYEGISVALLEAMASGVVPIVAKVGGQEEVVGSEAGLLIPHGPNELAAYTQGITNLLANPAQRQRMAEQGRLRIERQFSWHGMIEEFLKIIDFAHRMREQQPRTAHSPALALELATLSLENKRLAEALHWLWNSPANPSLAGSINHSTDITAMQATPQTRAEAAMMHLALRVSRSYPLQWLLRQPWLIAMGKKWMRA
jgi:glycosyltransferase involved in cell wall biosynthesis